MKRLIGRSIFLIGLALSIPTCVFAQREITLRSQAEVDAFDRTTTEQDVIISGADITNLDHLINLTEVGGLSIVNNPILVSISGLSNLAKTGSISISNNSLLTSIDALTDIVFNNATVYNEILIDNNPKLTHIAAFTVVTKVSAIRITHNPELTDVALGSVKELNGLFLSDNAKLLNLDGFNAITTVESLAIREMPQTTIDGFAAMTELGSIDIRNNPNLIEVSGFQLVRNVGFFVIENNPALQRLNGFPLLTGEPLDDSQSPIAISLYGNAMLTDVSAFSNVRIVSRLAIYNNASLNNVDGFHSVHEITETQFAIVGNTALENLDGLTNLSQVSFGENATYLQLQISKNPALTDPCGIFPFVNAVNNDLPGAFEYMNISENGFTREQLKACGQPQPPYSTPIVRLNFDEPAGVDPINSGTASTSFV